MKLSHRSCSISRHRKLQRKREREKMSHGLSLFPFISSSRLGHNSFCFLPLLLHSAPFCSFRFSCCHIPFAFLHLIVHALLSFFIAFFARSLPTWLSTFSAYLLPYVAERILFVSHHSPCRLPHSFDPHSLFARSRLPKLSQTDRIYVSPCKQIDPFFC